MSMEHTCKVDEVIAQYGLETADPRYETLDEGLLARWTGADDQEPRGYRPLTEWFNRRLLRAVYDDHGRDALGDRVAHDYRALTGDDDLVREELLESLAADGIDGAAVRADMVSWGTMRTHLQDCLEGTKETPEAGDWERDSVEMARSFATEKVESALASLAAKGDLAGFDDASVALQVQLRCDHCPTTVPLAVALDQGYVCADHADRGVDA